LGVFLRHLAVPECYLTGVLEGQGADTVLLAVAQPEHVANSDPPAMWQALGGRLRPGLSLVATAPLDTRVTKWTKAVRECVVALVHGQGPHAARARLDTSFRVSVAGLVVDQESAQPLEGVEVHLEGRELQTEGR